jgi:serine/threonine protein kinase
LNPMGIVQSMCALALQPVGGEGAGALVNSLLDHFSDRGQLVVNALRTANERAWKALEIALLGNSWWQQLKGVLRPKEDQAFAQQVRAFLDGLPLEALAGQPDELRKVCLGELQQARQKKLLTEGNLSTAELARQVKPSLGSNPDGVLKARLEALRGVGEELRGAGYPRLAWLVEQQPRAGSPLLVLAVRHFFRREVETNAELARGLLFTQLDTLSQSQQVGLQSLNAALVQQGARLDQMLGGLMRKAEEIHDAVRRHGEQLEALRQEIALALRKNQLDRGELKLSNTFSIRNDGERQLVRELLQKYRGLPAEQRRQTPELLLSLGVLQAAAGEVAAAQRDIETAAELFQDPQARADAHISAYRAALENRDWKAALAQLSHALKLDATRLAPFPLARYQPLRILGAGGFGVAFLCQHRHMGNLQVVKALFQDELERSMENVFGEAALLSQLEDPAFVRMTDCGYVNAAGKSRPYLVMDYFDGIPLEDFVKEHGPLSPADVKQIIKPIAQGLLTAHGKGILHRDVKPANVLVREEEDGWRVKLIDFGLALKQDALRNTIQSPAGSDRTLIGMSVAGTVDYAAPEQMGKLEGALGPHSDVYGFGKTCTFALLGTPIPDEVQKKKLDAGWKKFLNDCTANPENRLPDFGAVLKRIGGLRGAKKPAARRERDEDKEDSAENIGAVTPPEPPLRKPTFQVKCPHCPQQLTLEATHAGMDLKCPRCSRVFRAPKFSLKPLQVRCPHCPQVLAISEGYRGQVVKCPTCSGSFRLK